ncbi:MAG: T9SS type A sorting domain-containing protein [Chitinophagaceae bacterium]
MATSLSKYCIFLPLFIIAAKESNSQLTNIEWPAAIVEMHYNNSGPDVNEYIEIHHYYYNSPFYFPYVYDFINEIRFYDNLGVLYKTLPVNSMQIFYSGGWGNYGPHVFSYYQFPVGENFADEGKVELINLFNGVTVLADYVYNGAGITENRYIRPIAPRFFPDGEDETTPAGSSLNFCGYYYSTSWSTSIMASSYGSHNACLILPVNFTFFNYTIINNAVRLQWQTASESNTDRFEIERSTNGADFSKIGIVASKGASNTSTDYIYLDYKAAAVNFYRIRQVDKDGKASYSKVLSVKFKADNPLTIQSTIITDHLAININLQQQGINSVMVYDFSGRALINSTCKSGYNEIDVSNLSSGNYLIRLQTSDGKNYSQRFIKQ